ncbi:hypothetical protein [Morganella morganii]|uniref:hypothetical protein n=1 Tax=Morganella morganii TaxID=582 RepID=UPI00062C178D|nr:hypothetical protein [Morganella morganii]KKY64506.1 hypothetical protein OA40_15820 [Morganella morganii]KNZ89547.1 hypothetical protein AKG16_04115 [Morganella morganii]NIH20703.1 hypothetical protein [Morganella morganii]
MSEKMIAAAKEFAKNKRGTFPMMKFSDFPLFFSANKARTSQIPDAVIRTIKCSILDTKGSILVAFVCGDDIITTSQT